MEILQNLKASAKALKFFPLIVCTASMLACSDGGSGSESTQSKDACSTIGLTTKVINGIPCDNLQRASVVRVALVLSIGSQVGPVPVCTGTVIAPRAVLTAAHCLMGEVSRYHPLGSGIILGTEQNPDFIWADSVTVHPAFSLIPNSSGRLVNDIAILNLGRDAPVPSLPLLAGEEPQVGDRAFVYGYGQTVEGEEPPITAIDFSNLQGGQMRIQDITPQHIFVVFSGSGANVCQGDSGGPLVLLTGGSPAVAGVVSEGSVRGCRAGDTTSYINVTEDSMRNWILSRVPEAALR